MSRPVVWFEVLGEDAKALQSFYGELFGWKIDANNPAGYGTVEKAEGGIPGGVGPKEKLHHGVTFYVGVPDVAAELARSEKLGGKTVLPPTTVGDGTQLALLQDPAGNIVGLVRAPA